MTEKSSTPLRATSGELKMACPKCNIDLIVIKDGLDYYTCGYRSLISECGNFIEKVADNCTCDTFELFWGGCKCGWIQKERERHVNQSRTS